VLALAKIVQATPQAILVLTIALALALLLGRAKRARPVQVAPTSLVVLEVAMALAQDAQVMAQSATMPTPAAEELLLELLVRAPPALQDSSTMLVVISATVLA